MNRKLLTTRLALVLAFFVWVPLTGLIGVRGKLALYPTAAAHQPDLSPIPSDLATEQPGLDMTSIETVTPQPDGNLVHIVKSGQSLWSIAVAYHTHIDDLQLLNGLPREDVTIYAGQKLLIPAQSEPLTLTASPDRPTGVSHTREMQGPTAIKGVRIDAGTAAILQPEQEETDSQTPIIPETGERRKATLRVVLAILAVVGIGLVALGLVVKG